MKSKLFVLALAIAAGTASAQNTMTNGLAGTFVDISALPGATNLLSADSDDVVFNFTSTVTNSVFSDTNVWPNSDGYVEFGGPGQAFASYNNLAIPAGSASPITATNATALFPYWDDMYAYAGNNAQISWIEGPAASFGLPASRGNVLIIQWTNMDHYFTSPNKATFQVQIYSNIVNHVAAQMLYQSTDFGVTGYNDGGSATVGFASGSTGGSDAVNNVQYSFNAAGNIAPGTVLSVLTPGASVPPAVAGTVDPAAASPGDAVVFTAAVTPGAFPTSTGLSVHGNLTAVGGGSNVVFHDDGLNGDAVAGDHVYSYSYAIPAAQAGGSYTVTMSATDAQGRTGNGAASGYIFNPQNLGTLVDGTATSADAPLSAAEVKWFKATISDCSAAAGRNLLVTTVNSTNGGDSEIGVYDNAGTLVANDDDSGGNALSRLSFGFHGTSGDIGPGLIYIAVGSFNTTFSSSFGAVSTGPANDFQLDLLQTNSFPPSAVAATTGVDLSNILMTVTVTPGINPDSTGIAVSADLSVIGGSSTQAFFDDGTHGDVTAGDNVFSYNFTTNASTPVGPFSVTATVTDNQNDNVSVTLNGTVVAAPDALDLGQIGAGAGGSEVVTTHDTDIQPGAVTWLKFSIGTDVTNDGSGKYLDIDTEPSGGPGSDGTPTIGSINDTELGLYSAGGTFLLTDDDDGSDWHSQLTFGDTNARAGFGNGVAPNGRDGALNTGTYYLAAGCFNSVFNNFFDASSASTASGTIQVNFRTNIPGGGATQCSVADVGMAGGIAGHDHLLNNNDFIAFITLFFANDPQADMGMAGGVAGSDGQWNNNDFIAFISHFFNDAANCNG